MEKFTKALRTKFTQNRQRRRTTPAEDAPAPTGAELVQRQDAQTQTSEELDQKQEAHTILQEKKDVEGRLKEATDVIAQLTSEKSSLEEELDAHRQTVQDMGKLLVDAHRECDELLKECEQLKAKLRATKH